MQRLEAEQLLQLGVSGATNGHLVLEPDGDPTPGVRYRLIKDNRAALVDPVPTNDNTQGYSPGSLWVTVGASVWWCGSAATGAAVWRQVGFAAVTTPGDIAGVISQSKIAPGEHPLGNVMDYHATGGVSASVIQYTRVWMQAGIILDRMANFVFTGANGTRDLRMGVYEQADPLDETLLPTNRVAQTNILAPVANGKQFPQLTTAPTGGSGAPTTYAIPVTGYYWTAHITDETALSFAVSSIYPVGLVPALFEAGIGNVLPAVATAPTPATSSVVYIAFKEQ